MSLTGMHAFHVPSWFYLAFFTCEEEDDKYQRRFSQQSQWNLANIDLCHGRQGRNKAIWYV
jgi:hypothetical protein